MFSIRLNSFVELFSNCNRQILDRLLVFLALTENILVLNKQRLRLLSFDCFSVWILFIRINILEIRGKSLYLLGRFSWTFDWRFLMFKVSVFYMPIDWTYSSVMRPTIFSIRIYLITQIRLKFIWLRNIVVFNF